MGWNDRLEIWDVYSGIQTLTATGELSALNLFTAPRTILLTVPGINARTADAIIAAREQQLINSTPELAKLTNAPINLDPFKYILFPSNELRLRLAMRGDRYERVIDLKLTGTELDSPYRINYSYLTPINRSAVQDRAPIPLPKPILTPLPANWLAPFLGQIALTRLTFPSSPAGRCSNDSVQTLTRRPTYRLCLP
jgi:hypothetical protein